MYFELIMRKDNLTKMYKVITTFKNDLQYKLLRDMYR